MVINCIAGFAKIFLLNTALYVRIESLYTKMSQAKNKILFFCCNAFLHNVYSKTKKYNFNQSKLRLNISNMKQDIIILLKDLVLTLGYKYLKKLFKNSIAFTIKPQSYRINRSDKGFNNDSMHACKAPLESNITIKSHKNMESNTQKLDSKTTHS